MLKSKIFLHFALIALIKSDEIEDNLKNKLREKNDKKSTPKPKTDIQPRIMMDGKIVGGVEVKIADFPYQLTLQYYGQHLCGASIVHKRFALTAAHCVENKITKEFSVRSNSTLKECIQNGAVHRVCQVFMHPKFDNETFDYDFALLKLCTPIQIGVGQHWIRFADVEPQPDTNAVVTGWGKTEETNTFYPTALRGVEVKTMTRKECCLRYKRKITKRMICAYANSKDACYGDSGGPLVIGKGIHGNEHPFSPTVLQIGVVSWGYGCARNNTPGVYANTASEYIWLASTILENRFDDNETHPFTTTPPPM